MAESRIESYDGKEVRFWYEDDYRNRHYVTMTVEEFISAVIDHLPDRFGFPSIWTTLKFLFYLCYTFI